MLQSRFGFAIASLVMIFVLLSVLLFFLFPTLIVLDASRIPVFVYFSMLFFLFIWYWITFGMLRQHTVKIELNESEITVRSFLGLGKKRIYPLSGFDGYSEFVVPPWNRHRKAVYLYREGKPAIKIHGHYLKNYEELAAFVAARVPNSGSRQFSQLQEIRDAFKSLQ
jgi:hypothetical protein